MRIGLGAFDPLGVVGDSEPRRRKGEIGEAVGELAGHSTGIVGNGDPSRVPHLRENLQGERERSRPATHFAGNAPAIAEIAGEGVEGGHSGCAGGAPPPGQPSVSVLHQLDPDGVLELEHSPTTGDVDGCDDGATTGACNPSGAARPGGFTTTPRWRSSGCRRPTA